MNNKKIILDLGSNNGDDIPYYLLKSDLVIAVEANPQLCGQILERFSKEISQGRLIVENCVLTVDQPEDDVSFYIHKTNHVLSQFPKPDESIVNNFHEVRLPSKNILDLIRNYGAPFYIKIDIEHYDQVVLRYLFENKIFPPYISAESHSSEIFTLLSTIGGYSSFKIVDGQNVFREYKNCLIDSKWGMANYSFPHHSAGPFGNDIKGEWMNKEDFSRLLKLLGLGWKDIHASKIDPVNCIYRPYLLSFAFV